MMLHAPSLRHADGRRRCWACRWRSRSSAPRPGALIAGGPVACATGALFVWIVWQDLATFTISDAALLAVAAQAFAFRWSSASAEGEAPWRAFAANRARRRALRRHAAAVSRGVLSPERRRRAGARDVKLAAAGALLVGSVGFSWALFAARPGLPLPPSAPCGLLHPGGCARTASPSVPCWPRPFGTVWLIEQALPRLSGG